MTIELSRDEVETLRLMLKEKIIDLDREINRTDAFKYKARLRQLDRTIERVVGELDLALHHQTIGRTSSADCRTTQYGVGRCLGRAVQRRRSRNGDSEVSTNALEAVCRLPGEPLDHACIVVTPADDVVQRGETVWLAGR